MNKHIFVFVRGGVVTGVADEKHEDIPNAVLIDFDNIEGGSCPVCSDGDYEQETPCKNCGYDYAGTEDTGPEAIRAYMALDAALQNRKAARVSAAADMRLALEEIVNQSVQQESHYGMTFQNSIIARLAREAIAKADGEELPTIPAPDSNGYLIEALEGLFENCAMIHKYGGEICNQKEATAAIEAARAAIAKAKGEQ